MGEGGGALICFLGATGFFLESSLVIKRRGGGHLHFNKALLSLQVADQDQSAPVSSCPLSQFFPFSGAPTLSQCTPRHR